MPTHIQPVDLFTAGIVDNRIGPVVCIGEATGAGGANVWESDDVSAALRSAGIKLPSLPQGASFRVAIRRAVRSGDADGMLIEDAGIAGQPYEMTRHDVLEANQDLINHCIGLLKQQPLTRMPSFSDEKYTGYSDGRSGSDRCLR